VTSGLKGAGTVNPCSWSSRAYSAFTLAKTARSSKCGWWLKS